MNRSPTRIPPGSIHDVIACRVRQARLGARLSQQRLADMLNVDQGHLSRVESRKARASVDLLVEIAALTEVSLSFLCGTGDAGAEPLPPSVLNPDDSAAVIALWQVLAPADRLLVMRLMHSLTRERR